MFETFSTKSVDQEILTTAEMAALLGIPEDELLELDTYLAEHPEGPKVPQIDSARVASRDNGDEFDFVTFIGVDPNAPWLDPDASWV